MCRPLSAPCDNAGQRAPTTLTGYSLGGEEECQGEQRPHQAEDRAGIELELFVHCLEWRASVNHR